MQRQREFLPIFGKGGMEYKGGKGSFGKGKEKGGEVRQPVSFHMQNREERFIAVPKKRSLGYEKGKESVGDSMILIPKKQKR